MASDFTTEVDRLADSLKNVLLMLHIRPAAAVVPARTSQPVVVPDMVADRLAALEQAVTEVRQIVTGQHTNKSWFTTGELAEMLGRSQFTIQERWCNDGRIECEKDPDTGKWRIPGHEVERLRSGGGLRPKKGRDQRSRM
jgi:hypothetical protein